MLLGRPASWLALLGAAACGTGAPLVSVLDDGGPDSSLDSSPEGAPGDVAAPPSRDASFDAWLADAARDAAPPSRDAGPDPPLAARTLVVGMSDFDFTDRTLAVRIGSAFYTCALPACTALREVKNTTGHNGKFALAGDRLYFSGRATGSIQDNVFSIAFDGTARQNRTNHVVAGPPQQSYLGAVSFSGGPGRVEQIVRWSRFDEAGYRTLVEVTSGTSANPVRVGRPTANTHENEGSLVRYFPEQMKLTVTENNPTRAITPAAMVVTGAALPLPVEEPVRIATSPRGPAVAHPMVVIREGGTLKACPTTTACSGWIDLGDLAPLFTLDGENLYLGGVGGLARCSLAEIANQHTCTPTPMVPREVVEEPIYLTEGAVVWKSGNSIRAASKTLGAPCPPGEGVVSGVCTACAAGEEPSPVSGRCEPCPRGTFAEGPGSPVCTACRALTSTAATGSTSSSACVACPPGETSNAHTSHLCAPITSRRVFLTAESHTGNFADDAALVGATPIAKADSFCMSSASRPDAAVFKAMLVDGVLRDAVGGLDWVFLPSSVYVQADGTTPLGTTNAAGLLQLPLTNPWDPQPGGTSVFFWTGIGAATWAQAPSGTCLGFSSASPEERGNMGIAGRMGNTSIGVGSASPCATPRRLVCVEQ